MVLIVKMQMPFLLQEQTQQTIVTPQKIQEQTQQIIETNKTIVKTIEIMVREQKGSGRVKLKGS